MCKISEVFKKCSDTRYLVARKQFRMAGKSFPVNAVYTQYDGVRYVCDSFPDYNGNHVYLYVWAFNSVYNEWERDIIATYSKNEFERKLACSIWKAHKESKAKSVRPIRERKPENFDRMMKSAVTRKKGGGSGQRLIPGMDSRDFGRPELEWKEHTTYAHWELSGNASMISLSCGYDY